LRIDQWISMDRDGASYFYHKDGLGSIIGLSNSSESTINSYDYDVFGEIKNETGSLINHYCFTGRELDTESALYYYRSRFYFASLGRFSTKDIKQGRISEPLTLNQYVYVNNNPATYVDPLGFAFTGFFRKLYKAAKSAEKAARSREEQFNKITDPKTSKKDFEKATRTYGTPEMQEALKDAAEAAKSAPGTSLTGPPPGNLLEFLIGEVKDIIDWAYDWWNDGNGGGGTQDGDHSIPDETLPVTLSSFTVTFDNGATILAWATQSETDNMGWNIYRGKNDDSFTNSEQINDELIAGYGTTSEPHDYIYEDEFEYAIPGDVYWYWLESMDLGGEINHYNMVAKLVIPDDYEPEIPPELPVIYGLYQNSPNPFNSTNDSKTRVFFCLHKSADVKINIYNIKGQLIKCIYNKYVEFDENKPKPKVTYWDGKNENGRLQSTGIYLYELKVNGKVFSIKRLILMR